MTREQAEVLRAFRLLRRHLPQTLRLQEAELEEAWFREHSETAAAPECPEGVIGGACEPVCARCGRDMEGR